MNKVQNLANKLFGHLQAVQLPPEIRMTLHGAIFVSIFFGLVWFLPTIFWFLIGVAIFIFVSFVIGFLSETVYQTWKNMREDYNDQYRVD